MARGGAAQSFRSIPVEAEGVEDMTFSTAMDEAITFGIETDDEQEPLMQWAIRIPEPKTGTLNFERFPFQREFYTELSHDKDGIIQKATQVGVSAWLLRWALYWADTQGLTALYVFPKDKQMSDFSHQRLRPLIKNTEYLMGRVPLDHINNVYLRQIGLGWLNLRGSQTKEALDSVDADVVAFDEYDTLVQENIPDAERRVTGPMSKGLIRRVGVPTVDDYGISKLYDHSDYRQWFVRLPGLQHAAVPPLLRSASPATTTATCTRATWTPRTSCSAAASATRSYRRHDPRWRVGGEVPRPDRRRATTFTG